MTDDDRRICPRYPLRAFAALCNSEKEWAAHVLDISYHGARVALLDEYHLCAGDAIQLRLEVPELRVPPAPFPICISTALWCISRSTCWVFNMNPRASRMASC